jgi:tRNA threonylcarbamoyl adenosine modification protein (Sua5/YciO/YrdC/YwlC family)
MVLPTDTIYALACDIYQPKAFDRICQIKGIRPDKAQFSLLCGDLSLVSTFAKPFDRSVYKLLNRALPGPFTFILGAGNEIPSHFRSRRKTIGLRIPDHKVILSILEELGHPLVVTSLHDPDEIREYPTDPEEIHDLYVHQVDLVVDSGAGKMKPSTIIDCSNGDPVVVREGAGDATIIL